ncbi:MAG: hypothetical protein ACM32F_07855 [Betaproteobacteria bacterium]
MPTKKKKKTDSAIVRTMNVEGISYQLRLVTCGNARCRKGCAAGRACHGPYWYRGTWNKKTEKETWKYIGKNEPTLADIAKHVDERGPNGWEE